MYTTLISPEALYKNLNDPHWRIFDCRFALADPEQGRRDYEHSHLPEAIYADLDQDLCGPILPQPGGFTQTDGGYTGRHPLPDVDTFVAILNRWGVTNKTQVIAYDDKGGGLAAARLWWMLRWVGHDAVAVLDGGWQGWIGKQYPVSSEQSTVSRTSPGNSFKARVRAEMLVSTEEVYEMRDSYAHDWLYDSRAPERYRGETEPIDPVAGHIPWSQNAPYTDTQTPDGFFRPQKELRSQFETLLGNHKGDHAVFYCGSGVTAAANLLALKYAGLGDGKLYAGSWSEWIADPSRPVAFVQAYAPPLDHLLTLGEDIAREYPWEDYKTYGLTEEHIPDLIRMALDFNLNWAMGDTLEVFAPLHAWRALGQLRAEKAIEPLMTLFHMMESNDWASEDLPEVYALIGPVALPALEAYLQDASHSLYPRVTAMNALEKIGGQHPAARERCVAVLTRQLEHFEEQDEEFNGFLVSTLIDLKAVESAPVMARAFAAEKVELFIGGDWEDVQVELGLLEESDLPEPPFNPFSLGNFLPERGKDFLGGPRTTKKEAPKEKAKRKLANKSQKINRKKKKKK